ncbi:MAG: lytic murein transglycosylase [Balneolaceae bacterium]
MSITSGKFITIFFVAALFMLLCGNEAGMAETVDTSAADESSGLSVIEKGFFTFQLFSSGPVDSLSFHEKYSTEISTLIEDLEKKGFEEIAGMLHHPEFEFYDGIGDRFRQSVERKSRSLDDYKGILQFEDKKNRMAGFMASYDSQLQKAEETYGISKYVISAIIAVESDFGTKTGRYNPFNSYVSMVIEGYRSDFARAQLEELLTFVQKNSLDVFELKSSYAGAVSAAQFIPYSLNRWFVGDDIFDMGNVIHSVANYLSHFENVTGSIEKAVHRYNPSTLYTSAVLDLAHEAIALAQSGGETDEQL